jgi:phospholipid transport system substrate-binding protein
MLMLLTKVKFLYLCVLCLVVFTVSAQELLTARQVVEGFQSQLLTAMKKGKQLGYSGRYEALYEPVSDTHDLTKIVRIVVGKEWEGLSKEQQDILVATFSKYSVASYAHNFKEYSGESFVFDSEEETARGGVVVHSHLVIPNDKAVKFDYNLKEIAGHWKIINIIANGVSDLAVKRSEYTNILQHEGFDALIAKINEKITIYSKQ